MLIIILTLILAILSVFIFYIYKKDIIEPSFIFCMSFFVLSFIACLNARKWELGLHINTFLVVLLGVIEFFVVGYIVKSLLKNKKVVLIKKRQIIKVNTILEYVFLVFIVFFNALFLYFVVKAVGNSFSNFSDIIQSIHKYDHMVKFSNQFNTVKLPFLIFNVRVFIIAAGYWFMYVLINNAIIEKKIKIQEVLIVLFAAIATMLTGSRTELFFMIISGIVFYICLINKNRGFKFNLDKKTLRIIAIIIISVGILFIPMANILGRKIKEKPFDYISIYCGAEIKNLDIFLQNQNNWDKNKMWGSQTFNHLVRTYGEKIGFKGYKPYKLDLPFQKVNNHSLGNVYTTFYPYIYDFGYIGEFVMVLIMSVISHLVYEFIKRRKIDINFMVLILIYGIVCSSLALSFFSNKFYENIFTMNFIKYIVSWYICYCIFCKIKFQKKAGLK